MLSSFGKSIIFGSQMEEELGDACNGCCEGDGDSANLLPATVFWFTGTALSVTIGGCGSGAGGDGGGALVSLCTNQRKSRGSTW